MTIAKKLSILGISAAAALALTAIDCLNPFSPEQRLPTGGGFDLSNSSPTNLFRNLETSYTAQSLDDFMSLLAEDFKFVVSPDFVPEQLGTRERLRAEDLDSDSSLEMYWGRDWEEENHKRIFAAADYIQLLLPCSECADSSKWKPWFDPASGRRKGIYIVIDNARLKLISQGRTWELTPSTQKFGLKKNPADTTLWIIGEWHDEG